MPDGRGHMRRAITRFACLERGADTSGHSLSMRHYRPLGCRQSVRLVESLDLEQSTGDSCVIAMPPIKLQKQFARVAWTSPERCRGEPYLTCQLISISPLKVGAMPIYSIDRQERTCVAPCRLSNLNGATTLAVVGMEL